MYKLSETREQINAYVGKVMAGIPAKGSHEFMRDIFTGKPYEEAVFFYKKNMVFKGYLAYPESEGGRETPVFYFGVFGCGYPERAYTLAEIKREYPGVYQIMMEPEGPEREPSFAPCVEGDYDDPGLVVFA